MQNEVNENYFGAQHVIALVDCHPDMFQKGKVAGDVDDEGHKRMTGIELSLKLVQTLLQQTIEQTVIRKTGKRNGVGLLLYNTKTTRDKNRNKNGRKSDEDSDENTDDDDDDKMDDEDDDDEEMDDESTDDEEEKSSAPPMETTVHRLLDLKPPGIKHVQTLRKTLQKQKTDIDLEADFCPSPDDPDPAIAPLQTALEESTRMFLSAKCVRDLSKNAKGKNEYDTKSIWIFTNQVNPYSDEQNQLIQNIATEVKEQRIRIIVWPLANHSETSKTNHKDTNDEFVSPFFRSIASEILLDQRLSSFLELLDGLEGIYRTLAKKRRTYYGPMHILRPGMSVGNTRSVEDPAIMIDWYSVVQLSRKPLQVKIDIATKKYVPQLNDSIQIKVHWQNFLTLPILPSNKFTKRETLNLRTVLEEDTGKEVAKFWDKPTAEQREYQKSQPGVQRFRQFFNFANELVPMTPKDMRKINEHANGGYAPGLTILGFKPRDSIPWYHCISKTYLIFPNDTDVKGSENAFMHLHAAMLRKNVLAVGEALHRESSQSRLVAMYPFEETDHLPPGMYVKSLPFEDDMRQVAPDAASVELHLQREHPNAHVGNSDGALPDRHNSSNTGINEFCDDDALFFKSDDKTTGNIASEELVGAAMNLMSRQSISSVEIGEDFENAALTEFYSYLKSVAFDTAKEENNYDTILDKDAILKIAGKEIESFSSSLPIDIERPKYSSSRKRVRKTVPDDSGIDWIERYRMDELGSCKVDQLKKYLRSVGLLTSGRKDDLVERVTKSLEDKNEGDKAMNMKEEKASIVKEKFLVESL